MIEQSQKVWELHVDLQNKIAENERRERALFAAYRDNPLHPSYILREWSDYLRQIATQVGKVATSCAGAKADRMVEMKAVFHLGLEIAEEGQELPEGVREALRSQFQKMAKENGWELVGGFFVDSIVDQVGEERVRVVTRGECVRVAGGMAEQVGGSWNVGPTDLRIIDMLLGEILKSNGYNAQSPSVPVLIAFERLRRASEFGEPVDVSESVLEYLKAKQG